MRAAWPQTARFLVAMLVLAALVAPASEAHGKKSDSTGLKNLWYAKPPPDFTFDLGNGPERLRDLIGRPVVLNFWATWCEPCRDELGSLEKLRETYGSKVAFLTIDAQPRGVGHNYLDQHNLAGLPVLEDDLHAVSDAYSIGPIPVTIILKSDGTVFRVMIGEYPWDDLKAALDAVAVNSP
jgi:thiol-disulfide isomerase/thioredoxin